MQGQADGLRIAPQLPADWPSARVVRTFRGAEFVIEMAREAGRKETSIIVDGKVLEGAVVRDVEAGRQYQVSVRLPG